MDTVREVVSVASHPTPHEVEQPSLQTCALDCVTSVVGADPDELEVEGPSQLSEQIEPEDTDAKGATRLEGCMEDIDSEEVSVYGEDAENSE